MNVARNPADAIYAFLRSLPLFSSLDDRTVHTVAASCSLRHVQKGRIVFLIGDPADALHGL
jgi:CRP-like cAMP-binding protein